MNTKMLSTRRILICSLLAGAGIQAAQAADLTVRLSPITSSQGKVMLALYDSEASFRKTAAAMQQADAMEGEMTFTFNGLEPGEYAVTVMHDLNGNTELDANLLGIPREPWGASLQGKRVFGPPSWNKTRFTLTDAGFSLDITMR